MGYDAVVFDNDGVLVDMADHAVLRDGVRRAFAAVGVDDPDETVVESLVSGVTVDHLQDVCRAYGIDPETFWFYRDVYSSLAQEGAITRGEKTTYDDVDALDAIDQPMGVVSSNQFRTVSFVLSYFDLEGHFETTYARPPRIESLRRKKPNPYYLDRALSDLDAETALFVGDSETDVEAAQRAGIDAAFIRRPHRADAALSVEPTYEVASLHEVASLAEQSS